MFDYSTQWQLQPNDKQKSQNQDLSKRKLFFNIDNTPEEDFVLRHLKYTQRNSSHHKDNSMVVFDKKSSVNKSRSQIAELINESFNQNISDNSISKHSFSKSRIFDGFKVNQSKLTRPNVEKEKQEILNQQADFLKEVHEVKQERLNKNQLPELGIKKLKDIVQNKPKIFSKQFYNSFKNETKYFDTRKLPEIQSEGLLNALQLSTQRRISKPSMGFMQLLSTAVKNKDNISHKFMVARKIKIRNRSPHVKLERKTPNILKDDELILIPSQEIVKEAEQNKEETYYKRRKKYRSQFPQLVDIVKSD